ncbi:low temperature requirement protein A [Streptomyces sp. NPDC051546]|uniref:low temperature requirement protein A n=1 Tax=Streptomyces sp. NPDC051546 TaxID=3365655 RepID=UPI0037B7C2B4
MEPSPDCTSAAVAAAEPGKEQERHASWNELFFDLVVVAGIGQLAHLLQAAPGVGGLGLYLVLYLAFWTVWACFTVYGDIAAAQTRTWNLLIAMIGMAVMAASVPGIETRHTDAFVIAYVLLRWFGGRIWERGKVVTDWPLAQYGAGSAPWLVSLFAPDSWRYWLWAAGVAIDTVTLLLVSAERIMRQASERFARLMKRRERHRPAARTEVPPAVRKNGSESGAGVQESGPRLGPGGTRPRGGPAQHPERKPPTAPVGASTDAAHLAERLGLYVIIVLGEGIIQIVDALTEHETWGPDVLATALGGSVLLIAIWYLSLLHGSDGVPLLRASVLAPRQTMALHAALTAALAALAGCLGLAVEYASGTLPPSTFNVMCGAMALYFTVSMLGAAKSGPGRTWLLGFALPSLLTPAILVLLQGRVATPVLVWGLAASVCWQIAYKPQPRDNDRDMPTQSDGSHSGP